MKKSFLEKMFEVDAYLENKSKEVKLEKKAFKMPIARLLFSPFGYLVDYFKSIAIMMLFYSLIMTVLSLIMGYSFLCTIPLSETKFLDLYCSKSGIFYFVYIFIKMLIMTGFIICFYNLLAKKQFDKKQLWEVSFKNVKVLGIFLIWIALNMVPLFSFYILIERVPNPNWKIETLFFAIVSIGFLVPFVLMRFYSAIGFFIETGKVASLKAIWQKTSGNGLRIIVALFMIVLFSILAAGTFYVNFKEFFASDYIWISAFSSEMIYSIITLLIVALVIGDIYIQRQILISSSGEEPETANEN